MPRPLFWSFAIPSLIVALVSWRILVLPMDLVMPGMAAYARQVPLAVWGHVLFAPVALALAPLQLSAGLRARRPALHRWSGRLYALSILIAAVAALALLPGSIASTFARSGFGTLAVLWIATTALGIAAGDFSRHRIWMTRSVALTFAAVTLRVIMAPLMAAGWTVAETYQVHGWNTAPLARRAGGLGPEERDGGLRSGEIEAEGALFKLERAKGFGPSTLTAGKVMLPELRPHSVEGDLRKGRGGRRSKDGTS